LFLIASYGDQTIPLTTGVPGDPAEEGEEYGDPATGVWEPPKTYKYICSLSNNH
jgi:hypothetical protein